MIILKYLFKRPTFDQAMTECMKAYIRNVEPETVAPLEALLATARAEIAHEAKDRKST
jgi:hypothetical protein